MTTPPLTEELVYLTLQGVFVGEHLQLRQTKSIRKAIIKHHFNPEIRALTLKYNIHTISTMAKTLLEDQIFASKTAAKARFPDVFEGPSSQHTQSTTSGSGISTSSAAAIQSAIPEPHATTSGAATVQRVGAYSPAQLLGIGEKMKLKKGKKKLETVGSQYLEFDSISLPLWDQHRILVRVQYTLEKACYDFAQKQLSGLLEREGWDCAEAVELNQWARTLLIYHQELNLDDFKDTAQPLPSLMELIVQLRHDAVHRIRLSSSALLQHLANAELLARLLRDDTCSRSMSTIRQKTQEAIERLVRNKQLLDDELADIKREFAAKRAELDRQEAALLEAAAREHKEPAVSVSGSFDRVLVSDDINGIDEKTDSAWSRVYDDVLPDSASSRSEGMPEPAVGRMVEEDAINATDKDVEMNDSALMAPVTPLPFSDNLVESINYHEQDQAEKDRDQALSIAAPSLKHGGKELDDNESGPKHLSKILSSNPDEPEPDKTTTVILEGSDTGGNRQETAAQLESNGSGCEDSGEVVLCERSISPVDATVPEAADDANSKRPDSPMGDEMPVEKDGADVQATQTQTPPTQEELELMLTELNSEIMSSEVRNKEFGKADPSKIWPSTNDEYMELYRVLGDIEDRQRG